MDRWNGYCPVCESATEFVAHADWYRDHLTCERCGSVPRHRALALVLSYVRPEWRNERIWEIAPTGPASEKLRRECAHYTPSQYWAGVEPGTSVDGVRCEDVERPSFADRSIDVVVSSDVFEHVFDVERALAEIARVLDHGGAHVWTVPQYPAIPESRPRVRRDGDEIEHLILPPEYHGDPVNPEGVLVTYDWGADLPARVTVACGLETTVHRIEARQYGILGEFREVFVTERPAADGAPARGSSSAQLRAELAAVHASTSWQVTRPLRAASDRLRALRGR